jgi:hypothetical protein
MFLKPRIVYFKNDCVKLQQISVEEFFNLKLKTQTDFHDLNSLILKKKNFQILRTSSASVPMEQDGAYIETTFNIRP